MRARVMILRFGRFMLTAAQHDEIVLGLMVENRSISIWVLLWYVKITILRKEDITTFRILEDKRDESQEND